LSDQLVYKEVGPKQIAHVLETMYETVSKEEETTIMMAAIALAITLQRPDIPIEKLIEGVRGVSEYIAMWLMETGKVN